jgi:hypothetical protein
MTKLFELYRYTHSDGTSKDWAVRRESDGKVTSRYGKTNNKLPSMSTRYADMTRMIRDKEAKGYVYVGRVEIDDAGYLHHWFEHEPKLGKAKSESVMVSFDEYPHFGTW